VICSHKIYVDCTCVSIKKNETKTGAINCCFQQLQKLNNLFISDGESKRLDLLSEFCQEKISLAMSILDNTVMCLLSGGIAISLLKLLSKEKTKFIDIMNLVDGTSKSGATKQLLTDETDVGQSVLKVIKLRCVEVAAFEEATKLTRHFINMCSAFSSGH